MLEAEKILDDAENVLEYRSEVESFPNSQDDTGAQAITVSQAKIANNEEGLDDKTHSYLRAAETIEYHHGELDPDADIEQIDHLHDVNDEDSSEILSDQESERHNENDSEVDEKEIVDYEEDFDVDDNDNNQEAENDEEAIDREGYQNVSEIENVNNDDGSENNDASKVVEDNDDEDISTQCWSDSLRRLDIPIPDEVTSDWLYELLLATVPEEVKSSIPGLIAELQDKIEIDDPQEEFKQLRTVKPTDDCTAANLVYNRDRNRFRNVLPCKLVHFN